MKKGKNSVKWLQAGMLGLVLWIVSDAGLLVNNWERLPGHGSQALAQDLTGDWVNLTQKCNWLNAGLRCKLSGKFKVQNQGTQKALSSKVRFFLSDDSTLEEANDILLKEIKVGPLNAEKSRIISLQITLPLGTSASDKFVIGLVDADSSVPETEEANNVNPSDIIPSGTEFFPFTLGDTWVFQGTLSGNIDPVGSYGTYVNTRTVTGSKVIDEVATTVFTESNPANVGMAIDEYLVKDAQGITYWGSSGETGLFPSQMVPFQRVYFPLQLKSSIKESFKGIDLGRDLDGDWVNEAADVTGTVTVAAFEEVSVPAGTFPNSLRIETKGTLRVTLSGYHRKIMLNVIQTEWFAYGVGPVKRTIKVTSQVAGQKFWEEMIEELIEFSKAPVDLSRLQEDGWVLLTEAAAQQLGVASKQYLYVYEDRWYLSPTTVLNWSWDFGQELVGFYIYFNGSAIGAFYCDSSEVEKPWWGIGCSEGWTMMEKVLPIYDKIPSIGEGVVCQDIPDAFGVGTCASGVKIYVREPAR